MLNRLAPQVVSPPWDRNSAWIRSATAATTTLNAGPSSTAARPVPQGCEQVPAVGIGIGMQEMTNTTAATMPVNGVLDKSWAWRLASSRSPKARNGAEATYQKSAQENGRIPSDMCMAK